MIGLLQSLRWSGLSPRQLHQTSYASGPSDAAASASSPVQAEGNNAAPFAAMSGSVSPSSDPKLRGDVTTVYRGVAHLFLTRMATLLAGQRRTNEASRPDWANHLPGHPASFVRSIRTVGSPQSCSGARYRRSTISGRFRDRNLVGLDPQSKCFFSYQECGALMAAPASQGPGRCPQDRVVAPLAPAPRG